MKRKKKLLIISATVFLLFFSAAASFAEIPGQINFQGQLKDDQGSPVVDNNYIMNFALYYESSGGTPFWSEVQTIAVVKGIYSVILGQAPNVLDPDSIEGDIYLGVSVESDQEMTPRLKITSTPFAMNAARAEVAATLNNLDAEAFARSVHDHPWNEIGDRPAGLDDGDDIGIVEELDPTVPSNVKDGVAWSEIANIPLGFADGTDDGTVGGITEELDPTVLASVKDGVAWSELSDIPVGFADGTDDDSGGRITSVIAGNGLSGGGSEEDIRLDVVAPLVLMSPYTADIAISGKGGVGGLYGESSDPSGKGVHGKNTGFSGYGGYFEADNYGALGVFAEARGEGGIGVKGLASNSSNVHNYGGFFQADGANGRGIFANASNTFGENYGGYFQARGGSGRAVYGIADNFHGENYGGYFQADGDNGRGIYGESNGFTGIGVHGKSLGLGGYGGYFEADYILGVFAEARGEGGIGVKGLASNSSNVHNYGGFFQADGANGRGIFAYASNTTGENYGGYFEATGISGRGVFGQANSDGDGEKYGGYFLAGGHLGRGVFGKTTGSNGIGVYGRAEGTNSTGVYGYGTNYNFYANGPAGSVDYGTFTGGHEVRLENGFPENVKTGMVISITGKVAIRPDENGIVSISSTLPTIRLADVTHDKKVFGVFVKESPLQSEHWYEAENGERFAIVNALGEGRVWVSNINGDIEAGDYITTSPVSGYGQIQDDDILHSYTLGKATETVDWDAVTETVEYGGQEIKVYLIAVVYTSG